jgi:acyl carrier protein
MSVRDLWQAISIEARAILVSLPLVMGIYADWLTILSAHLRPGQERAQVVRQSSEPPIPDRRPITFDAGMELFREIVAQNLSTWKNGDDIVGASKLVEDLGARELDIPVILFDLEDSFGCEISYQRSEDLVTVGDVMRLVKTYCDA